MVMAFYFALFNVSSAKDDPRLHAASVAKEGAQRRRAKSITPAMRHSVLGTVDDYNILSRPQILRAENPRRVASNPRFSPQTLTSPMASLAVSYDFQRRRRSTPGTVFGATCTCHLSPTEPTPPPLASSTPKKAVTFDKLRGAGRQKKNSVGSFEDNQPTSSNAGHPHHHHNHQRHPSPVDAAPPAPSSSSGHRPAADGFIYSVPLKSGPLQQCPRCHRILLPRQERDPARSPTLSSTITAARSRLSSLLRRRSTSDRSTSLSTAIRRSLTPTRSRSKQAVTAEDEDDTTELLPRARAATATPSGVLTQAAWAASVMPRSYYA